MSNLITIAVSGIIGILLFNLFIGLHLIIQAMEDTKKKALYFKIFEGSIFAIVAVVTYCILQVLIK